MNHKVFAKPSAAGLKVPLPPAERVNGRKHFAADGELVADCTFVRRLERDGDLFVGADKSECEKRAAEHEAACKADAEKRAAKAAKHAAKESKAAKPAHAEARASKAGE